MKLDDDSIADRRTESGFAEPEPIRVTDKRRIRIDDDGTSTSAADEPSLKPSYVEELEARTRAAELKLVDVQSRFDQIRADLRRETDETRQRLTRAADERVKREKAEFIGELLHVLDNIQRAIQAFDSGNSVNAIIDGLRGTASSFENVLIAAGVEPVDSVGAQFDPELHEAVDTTVVDAELEGRITAEYSRGYKIGDRLLRPARVQVGHVAASASEAGE